MALFGLGPAEDSADNFTPARTSSPGSAQHLQCEPVPNTVPAPQQPPSAPCADQAPRAGPCSSALQAAVAVRCASSSRSSGGRCPPMDAPVSTRSLSSDTSWGDTQDHGAVEDGLLSLSSGTYCPSSCHSGSSGGGNDDDEPDSKRPRLNVRTLDRCKDADCARVVLRKVKSTFRADEIVGRKLVLF